MCRTWAPVWWEMDVICCLPTYFSLRMCYDCLGTFHVEQRRMLYKQLTHLGHFLQGPQIVMMMFVWCMKALTHHSPKRRNLVSYKGHSSPGCPKLSWSLSRGSLLRSNHRRSYLKVSQVSFIATSYVTGSSLGDLYMLVHLTLRTILRSGY